MSFGVAIASIEQSDTMVTIYGDSASLDNITSIIAPIDVSNLKEAYQYKVELEKPVGIRSMSINTVNVKVQVSQSTDIDIPNVRINAINLDSAYNVQAKSENDFVVTVNAKGVSSVIEKLTAEDINASCPPAIFSNSSFRPVSVEPGITLLTRMPSLPRATACSAAY